MARAGGVGGRDAPLEMGDQSAVPVDGVLTRVLLVGVPSPWFDPVANRSMEPSSVENTVTLCAVGAPGFVPGPVLGMAGG